MKILARIQRSFCCSWKLINNLILMQGGDITLKMLLVGNAGVGKTSHIMRFTDCIFTGGYSATMGVDFKKTTREIAGRSVVFQIWDTAGQERFRTITSSYYKGSAGIFLVYDISYRESFSSIKQSWMGEVKKHAPDNVELILIGAKSDLQAERVVTFEEGAELAKQLGIAFMETSSKEDNNVAECFQILAEQCLRKIQN